MNIFIADYLPIKNKGEEALLRGIESLYKEKYKEDINFFVFGQSDEIEHDGNITSFPVKWCYPTYKYPKKFAGRVGFIKRLLCSLTYQIGLSPYVSEVEKHSEVMSAFAKADKILLAHDGFYNTFCAALGLFLKKKGYNYSVPGTGFMPQTKYGFFTKGLDYKFYNNSDYNVFREQTCFDYVNGMNLKRFPYLLPDMAFYCKTSDRDVERSKAILDKYNIGKDQNEISIGLTMCENSISFHGSFLNMPNKSDVHRNFIAQLLDNVSNNINCKFYFIPHCIEKGAGDDLVIAEDIINRMKNKDRVVIIREDLPVNVLRPILHNLDFVLGERTHSIINSTSMCTPYFMLTCKMDFRSHDIIGKGIGLPNQIIDLDSPRIDDVTATVIKGISNRKSIKQHLESYKSIVAKSRETLLSII